MSPLPRFVRQRRNAVVRATTAVLAAACAGSRAPTTTPPAGQTCALAPAPATAVDSAAVALTTVVNPGNAPSPFTWAERFVFAHAYETLVRIDCLGRATGGLAKSWTPVDGGPRWRVVLRDGARFWNGDAVTAGDVIASWRATGRAPTAVLARRLAESSTAIDDTTLEIAAQELTPGTLGDPELAVAKHAPQSRWPEGTGPYRIREPGRSADRARSYTLVVEPIAAATGPRLTIHSVPEVDARDLVDAGVDLLITEDHALSAYGSARPDVSVIPLGWDRTWVLVTPRQVPIAAESTTSPETLMARTLSFRAALARDAVRADARPSPSAVWPPDGARCTVPGTPPTRSGRASSRVVYRRDEPVARALAERLVAVAGSGGDSSLAVLAPELMRAGVRATAVALAPDEFDASLRGGSELAFVVAVPLRATAPCRPAERLLAAAPWLGRDQAGGDVTGTIAPLVDTRPRAIVRRDRLSLMITWDSTVTVSTAAPGGSGGRP